MATKHSRFRLPKDLNPRELASFTSDKWRALDGEYLFWRTMWRRTLDFVRGLHWKILEEIDPNKIPDWRRLPSLGYTLSIYIDEVAAWLQSDVRYTATPISPDPKDIAAAELAEGALRYAWNIMEVEDKKPDIAAWLAVTGNSALRTFWDEDTGNLVPVGVQTEQGFQPVDPESGQPLPPGTQPVMVDAGELGLEVLNPSMVRWPRSKKDGVMTGMELTEDEVAVMFGEEWVDKLGFSRAMPDKLSLDPVAPSLTDTRLAFLIEHQIPRSKDFPGGLWWVADPERKLIVRGPHPLPGGIPSITPFRWVPQPGTRVGLSPLYQITFSNKMMDEVTGKAMEHVAKVVPKMLLKDGGGIEKGELNEEPFQELMINEGGEPVVLDAPEVPEFMYRMRELGRQDIEFASGLALAQEDEPKPGSAQGGVRQPTKHVRRSRGPAVELMEISSKPAWKHFGRVTLGFIKSLYDENRVFAIVGRDKLHQWLEFSEESLERLPMNVEVDEIALYSFNRQNMRDTVISLLATPASQVLFGDIGPDGQFSIDKDRIETALSAAGIDSGVAELDPDVAEARNEHALLRAGQPVEAGDHQNHAAHVAEHEKVMKSINFRAWEQEAQDGLRQNIQQHKDVLQQAAEAESQALIEQERAMREVRETAEMQADVKKELAGAVIEGLKEFIVTTMTQLAGGEADGEGKAKS